MIQFADVNLLFQWRKNTLFSRSTTTTHQNHHSDCRIRFIPITPMPSTNTITISDVCLQRIICKSEVPLYRILFVAKSTYKKEYDSCHIKNKYKENSDIAISYQNDNKSTDSISPITQEFVVTADTTCATLYGEASITMKFDTTTIFNRLLLRDGDGTVIIGGSSPTPSPATQASIEIAVSVFSITNHGINNEVSTIPFDTDTTVLVYAEVAEPEDQIAEILVFSMENGLVQHSLIQSTKVDIVQILQHYHLIDLVVNSDFTT